ncbi:MAG: hypothetical protein KA419_20200 [Acidobacteria bacterium]|nr:hypothetical protein [Acidobacteriota bacterium]
MTTKSLAIRLFLLLTLAVGSAWLPPEVGYRKMAEQLVAFFRPLFENLLADPPDPVREAELVLSYDSLSEEEKKMLRDAGLDTRLVMNPAMTDLIRATAPAGEPRAAPPFRAGRRKPAGRLDLSSIAVSVRDWGALAVWALPALGLACAGFLAGIRRPHAAQRRVRWVFEFGRGLLVVLSGSALAAHLLFRYNLLYLIPWHVWFAPVVFTPLAGVILHFSRRDFPFWRRTLAALALPGASALVVAAMV